MADLGGPHGRILVVEDDEASRGLLRAALELDGTEVLEAGTGADALRRAQCEDIDAILLDLTLPDTTGFDVLRSLKARPGTRNVPVIIVTGRTGTDECVEGLALGAHDFVRKPYDVDELLARVAAARALRARLAVLEGEAVALERLALTDALTGLDNRRAAERQLVRLTARAQRGGGAIGVLMVDVDRFKDLNDRHGHLVGDAVLRAVAERLSASARTGDIIARWGGEEFLVLLPDTNPDAAQLAAERLVAAVAAEPVVVGATAIAVTVSVGVAAISAGKPQDLVAEADAALYQAKRDGRNRVVAAVRAADAARRGFEGLRRAEAPEARSTA
jgi:two-component system, cell cycle response regulator